MIALLVWGIIEIEINIENNVLKMQCKNTFSSSNTNDKLLKSNGIGLENVKARLELLYPNAFTLEIDDNNQMYNVNLSIKLDQLKR